MNFVFDLFFYSYIYACAWHHYICNCNCICSRSQKTKKNDVIVFLWSAVSLPRSYHAGSLSLKKPTLIDESRLPFWRAFLRSRISRNFNLGIGTPTQYDVVNNSVLVSRIARNSESHYWIPIQSRSWIQNWRIKRWVSKREWSSLIGLFDMTLQHEWEGFGILKVAYIPVCMGIPIVSVTSGVGTLCHLVHRHA